jgi:hypothetical protein
MGRAGFEDVAVHVPWRGQQMCHIRRSANSLPGLSVFARPPIQQQNFDDDHQLRIMPYCF